MICPKCEDNKYAPTAHSKNTKDHLTYLRMKCFDCGHYQIYYDEEADKVLAIYNGNNKTKPLKFAIDIHGVIDENPKFFRRMCKSLVRGGMEVHILTGKHLENKVHEELLQLGFLAFIHYTDLFSMADYHKEKGTKMWGDTKNPYMADADWDRTKADYCRRNQIDFCLDDKEQYMKYFLTPVALYKSHIMHLTNSPKKHIIKDEEPANDSEENLRRS